MSFSVPVLLNGTTLCPPPNLFISWGGAESAWTTQAMPAMDQAIVN
jgi:hypothetical protein